MAESGASSAAQAARHASAISVALVSAGCFPGEPLLGRDIGGHAFAHSTLLRLLNQGNTAAVPDEIRRWTRARGRTGIYESSELAERRKHWRPPEPRFDRGYGKLFRAECTQAHEGCDFKFLHHTGGRPTPEPDIY